MSKRETALITGASAGIGYELALRFAREGHPLVLVSRSREKLSRVAADIKQKVAKIKVGDAVR